MATGAASGLAIVEWSPFGRLEFTRHFAGDELLVPVEPDAVAARTGGGLLAAGRVADGMGTRMAVVALDSRGTPVDRFAEHARATFSPPGSNRSEARAVAIGPEGTVLVGGSALISGHWQPVVVRLSPDGRVDPSFGEAGTVVLPLSGAAEPSRSDNNDRAQTGVFGLAVQTDGKVVAVGSALVGGRAVAVVARLLPDGRPDAGLAGSGVTTFSFLPTGPSGARAVSLDRRSAAPDAGIVVAGKVGRAGAALARLAADGRLDSSFGGTGRVALPVGATNGASSVRVLADGRVVVAAGTPDRQRRFMLARLTATGRLDRTFGGTGLVCTALSRRFDAPTAAGTFDTVGLVVRSDGRALIGGAVQDRSLDVWWVAARYVHRFVSRLQCFDVTPRRDYRRATVSAALGRAGRFALEVVDLREFCRNVARPRAHPLGRAQLGLRGPGLTRFDWNMRVGGRALRSRGCYRVTPVIISSTGRVLTRGPAADL